MITKSELGRQDKTLMRLFWGTQAIIGGGVILTGSWWLLAVNAVVLGGSAIHAINKRKQFTEPTDEELCDNGSRNSTGNHMCVKAMGHSGKCICECQGNWNRHVMEEP